MQTWGKWCCCLVQGGRAKVRSVCVQYTRQPPSVGIHGCFNPQRGSCRGGLDYEGPSDALHTLTSRGALQAFTHRISFHPQQCQWVFSLLLGFGDMEMTSLLCSKWQIQGLNSDLHLCLPDSMKLSSRWDLLFQGSFQLFLESTALLSLPHIPRLMIYWSGPPCPKAGIYPAKWP